MEEFFNTNAISFVALPDKLICVKTVGFKDLKYELPPIPSDENPAELRVNLDMNTVCGSKYIYLNREWRKYEL